MKRRLWLFLSVATTASTVFGDPFPSSLKIGAASSAYQVEGAWNDSGKSSRRTSAPGPKYAQSPECASLYLLYLTGEI